MLRLNQKKKGKTRKNKRTAALSTIQTGTINTFGERDGITNDSEILMQPEIAIASSSNEIVEVEIVQTN